MNFNPTEVLNYFKSYFKNPLHALKNVPDWDWPTVLITQFILSICIGLVTDFMPQNHLVLLKGIYFFPLSSFTTTFLGTSFFYFLILIFFNNNVDFLKLYITVFLSHVPFLILRIIRFWTEAPIEPIGFAATTALLTVGFVENFQLPKKKMIQIFGAIFAIYIAIWIFQQIYNSKNTLQLKHEMNKSGEMQQIETIEEIQEELE